MKDKAGLLLFLVLSMVLFAWPVFGEVKSSRGVVADTWNVDWSNAEPSLFTGDFAYGLPLLSFPGKGGLSFDVSLRYSSDVNETLYAENKERQASKVGLGWDFSVPYITVMSRDPFLTNDTPFPQSSNRMPLFVLSLPSGTYTLVNVYDPNGGFDGSNELCTPDGSYDECQLFYAIDDPLIRAKYFIDWDTGNNYFVVQDPSGFIYMFQHRRSVVAMTNLQWDSVNANPEPWDFGKECNDHGIDDCNAQYYAFDLISPADITKYVYQYDVTAIVDPTYTNWVWFNWVDVNKPYSYSVVKSFQRVSTCSSSPGTGGSCYANPFDQPGGITCTNVDKIENSGTYISDAILDSVEVTVGQSPFWDPGDSRLESNGVVGYVYKFIYNTRTDVQVEQTSTQADPNHPYFINSDGSLDYDDFNGDFINTDFPCPEGETGYGCIDPGKSGATGYSGMCEPGFTYFSIDSPGIFSEKLLKEVRLLYFGPGDNLESSADILQSAVLDYSYINKAGTVNTSKLRLDSVTLKGKDGAAQPSFSLSYNTDGLLTGILTPLGGSLTVGYEPRSYAYTGGTAGIVMTNITRGDVLNELLEYPGDPFPPLYTYSFYHLLSYVDFHKKKYAEEMTGVTGMVSFTAEGDDFAEDKDIAVVVGDIFNVFLVDVSSSDTIGILDNMGFSDPGQVYEGKRAGVETKSCLQNGGGLFGEYRFIYTGKYLPSPSSGIVSILRLDYTDNVDLGKRTYRLVNPPSGYDGLINSVPVGFTPRDLKIVGNYLYVGGYNANTHRGKLAVLSLADCSAPVVVRTIDLSDYSRVYDLEVMNDQLFIGTDGGMKVFSLADPSNPALVTSVLNDRLVTRITRTDESGLQLLYVQASLDVYVFEELPESPYFYQLYSAYTPDAEFIAYGQYLFTKDTSTLGDSLDDYKVFDVFSESHIINEDTYLDTMPGYEIGCTYNSDYFGYDSPDNYFDFVCEFGGGKGTMRIRRDSETGQIVHECARSADGEPWMSKTSVQLSPATYYLEMCVTELPTDHNGMFGKIKNRYSGPGPYSVDIVSDIASGANSQFIIHGKVFYAGGTRLAGFQFKESSSGETGWRVQSLTTNDGLGSTMQKTYAYDRGNYDVSYEGYYHEKCMDSYANPQSNFPIECRKKHGAPNSVGYNNVTVTVPNNGRTEYYFYNGLSPDLCPNCPLVRNGGQDIGERFFSKGKSYATKVYAEGGSLVSEENTVYEQHSFTESFSEGVAAYIHAMSMYPIQSTVVKDGTTITTDYSYDWDVLNRPLVRSVAVTGSKGEVKKSMGVYAYELSNSLFVHNLLNLKSYELVGHAGMGGSVSDTVFSVDPLASSGLDALSVNVYDVVADTPLFGKPLWSASWLDSDGDNVVDGSPIASSPELVKTQFGYDAFGRVNQVTNPKGLVSYVYYEGSTDPCNDVAGADVGYGQYFPTCFKDALGRKELNLYNSHGDVVQFTDQNLQVSKFDYDSFWRPIKSFKPGDAYPGSPSEEFVYSFARDVAPYTLSYSGDNPVNWRLNSVLTKIRLKDGTGDDLKKRTTAYADGLGRSVSATTMDTDNDVARPLRVKTTYNAIGLVEKNTEVFKTQVQENPDYSFMYYQANPLKRVDKVSPVGASALFISTDYAGNASHIITTATDEAGKVSKSAIEKIGRVGETIQAVGLSEAAVTSTVNNDILGRSTDTTNNAGQITKTRSDTLGRVRVSMNPDYGVRRNLKYDLNGNLILSGDGCLWNSGQFSWDGTDTARLGQLCSMSGRFMGYSYDSLDRLRCVKYGFASLADAAAWSGSFSGTCASGSQVKYYYDDYSPADLSGWCSGTAGCNSDDSCPKGRLVAVINAYSGDAKYCYFYDARGQLRKELRLIAGSTPYQLLYSYDNAGNMISMTYPNNRVVSYDYNVLNQVEAVKVDATTTLQTLLYRPDGLVQSKTYKRTC